MDTTTQQQIDAINETAKQTIADASAEALDTAEKENQKVIEQTTKDVTQAADEAIADVKKTI